MGRAIILKSAAEIEVMREANQIVASTLSRLRKLVQAGITTLDLDRDAEQFCRGCGAEPAFKGYRGFPGSLCVSVNDQVVHGIPSGKVKLREGDIVSIDFGVRFKGFYGDAAITLPVGQVNEGRRRLMAVTEQALEKAIEQVQVGKRINDIASAVQHHVESNGFSVVRQFVGHGIGSQLHEPPEIPNYARRESTTRLVPGMVLAIEPMVNEGTHEVMILKDGWTVVTRDRKASAHFEHSVAVTEGGPLVLSRESGLI
ncbi:MAG: type I methionyl aminopeptidase [Thermodesulfobacteriota bacterium]